MLFEPTEVLHFFSFSAKPCEICDKVVKNPQYHHPLDWKSLSSIGKTFFEMKVEHTLEYRGLLAIVYFKYFPRLTILYKNLRGGSSFTWWSTGSNTCFGKHNKTSYTVNMQLDKLAHHEIIARSKFFNDYKHILCFKTTQRCP